ncbi:MAG TPA: polysaccharide pyruvyl transferase family protein, partial [Rhizomicrobium sp.]|nr:polysaccharide pyruvyl transferase family protein [Rhizomicrobium sp.]
LVERDRPNALPADAEGPYKIVFNGWHTHAPENWPPSPRLIPLLVSVHITGEMPSLNKSRLRPADALLQGYNLEFLKSREPVGARDLWTRDLLRAAGVETYFSGCMTLTLGSGAPRPRRGYICAAGFARPVPRNVRAGARSRWVEVSHEDRIAKSFEDRMTKAEKLLSLYAHAKCVVTSKLHCALPCLALGTPVLLVASAHDSYRFSGLRDLLHSCTPENFRRGTADFNFDNPPPNKDAYRAYRDALIETVNPFVDPARAGAAAPLHPFEPDGDIDKLLAQDWSGASANPLRRLRGFFGPA